MVQLSPIFFLCFSPKQIDQNRGSRRNIKESPLLSLGLRQRKLFLWLKFVVKNSNNIVRFIRLVFRTKCSSTLTKQVFDNVWELRIQKASSKIFYYQSFANQCIGRPYELSFWIKTNFKFAIGTNFKKRSYSPAKQSSKSNYLRINLYQSAIIRIVPCAKNGGRSVIIKKNPARFTCNRDYLLMIWPDESVTKVKKGTNHKLNKH